LAEIGLPVFSYGSYPPGPVRLDEREPGALTSARFGPHEVTAQDIVVGDDDGVLFVTTGRAAEVLATAHEISADRTRAGPHDPVRSVAAATDRLRRLPRATVQPIRPTPFRRHLRRIGGAIEE
jgi:regulator of RNase E activity RraA